MQGSQQQQYYDDLFISFSYKENNDKHNSKRKKVNIEFIYLVKWRYM